MENVNKERSVSVTPDTLFKYFSEIRPLWLMISNWWEGATNTIKFTNKCIVGAVSIMLAFHRQRIAMIRPMINLYHNGKV